MIMRNAATRLILWIAEILDRNLIIVPDVDLSDECCDQRSNHHSLTVLDVIVPEPNAS